jgi:retron-type reverse transcriptase
MPRSYGSLFETVVSFGSLLAAFYRARRGKRGRLDVAAFEHALETNLLELQRDLLTGFWQPGAYRNFYVREHKRRLITAAPFRDRVVHHALHNVLEPLFEPRFIHDSYACRKGKGQHRAIDRFQSWARGHRYVLRGDITRFYPSVDHGILLRLLMRRVRDRRVLSLLARILDSGAGILEPEYEVAWFAGDDLFSPLARKRGLPIGNLTSQFFGNVYLNELDHFVKEGMRARCYLRYMDDFAAFGDDKAELHRVRAAMAGFLGKLRLTFCCRRTRLWQTRDGVEFLGFRVFPGHRRVRKATTYRYGRHLVRLAGAGRPGGAEVKASLAAWFGHVRHAAGRQVLRLVLRRAGLLAQHLTNGHG